MAKRTRHRDRLTWQHKARLEREAARAALTECAMPLCAGKVVHLDGKGLGICLSCTLDVVLFIEHVNDLPALTEKRMQRRLRHEHQAQKEADAKTSASLQPGWIYYLLIADRIKIGYSVDVKRRLRSYPPDSSLLALHPGTKQLEHDMHVKFGGSRAAAREWFLDTPELREHIKGVIFEFGEPDRARYEHRGQHKNPMRRVS